MYKDLDYTIAAGNKSVERWNSSVKNALDRLDHHARFVDTRRDDEAGRGQTTTQSVAAGRGSPRATGEAPLRAAQKVPHTQRVWTQEVEEAEE